jgi:hypothetical protein
MTIANATAVHREGDAALSAAASESTIATYASLAPRRAIDAREKGEERQESHAENAGIKAGLDDVGPVGSGADEKKRRDQCCDGVAGRHSHVPIETPADQHEAGRRDEDQRVRRRDVDKGREGAAQVREQRRK